MCSIAGTLHIRAVVLVYLDHVGMLDCKYAIYTATDRHDIYIVLHYEVDRSWIHVITYIEQRGWRYREYSSIASAR